MDRYRKVEVERLPDVPNPSSGKKEIDVAVGADELGFNVYAVAPGERVPWGYHSHPDHEEIFYVIEGTLTFETDAGVATVGPNEAFYVPPDAPQKCYNAGEEPVRVVAAGAPRGTDTAVIAEECPECGEVTDRTHEAVEGDDGTVYVLRCADCGAETDRFGAGPDG